MASVRLSVTIKEKVEAALIRYRFEAEAQALVDDYAALADEVYNEVYSELDRRKMAQLPKGWLPHRNDISVQFGDGGKDVVTLDFGGAVYGEISKAGAKRTPVPGRLVPYCDKQGVSKVYDSGHAFAERYAELKDRWANLATRVKELQSIARGTLDSVTTVGALLNAWPEVRPFLTKYLDAPAPVPALPIHQLNNLIGLPVDEEKAA